MKGETMPPLKIRWEVQEFAERMELKLRENDHKAHWRKTNRAYLMERLRQEMRELERAVRANKGVHDEAVDVANFAMMVFDFGDMEGQNLEELKR
jgi:hypothetical protein